jgi:putative endonuclease
LQVKGAAVPTAKWWVYVLRCADGTLYTGVTTDVARRVERHNAGTASKYTRGRRPVTLAYREPAAGHGAALRREYAIKRLPRASKELLVKAARSRRGGRTR